MNYYPLDPLKQIYVISESNTFHEKKQMGGTYGSWVSQTISYMQKVVLIILTA